MTPTELCDVIRPKVESLLAGEFKDRTAGKQYELTVKPRAAENAVDCIVLFRDWFTGQPEPGACVELAFARDEPIDDDTIRLRLDSGFCNLGLLQPRR